LPDRAFADRVEHMLGGFGEAIVVGGRHRRIRHRRDGRRVAGGQSRRARREWTWRRRQRLKELCAVPGGDVHDGGHVGISRTSALRAKASIKNRAAGWAVGHVGEPSN